VKGGNEVHIDALAALRNTELFRDVSEGVLKALGARAVARKLGRDEVLFVMGEQAKGLYVIASGSVRAYRTGSDGREQIIHTEKSGSTIGELPLFDDQPYPSTVAADDDALVLFLEKGFVRQMCQAHPEIAMSALRVLSRRLRKCAELVETLSLRAVGQRLAQWFLEEAGTQGPQSGTKVEVEIALSREQMASRIGSVREVVSRAMARLEEEGLIKILDGHRILIPDADRLDKYIKHC
jgi:CRP/FNR family transcriptional regulator